MSKGTWKNAVVVHGPDWQDVHDLVQAVEKLHGCSIKIELRTDQMNFNGQWFVFIAAAAPLLVGGGQHYKTVMSGYWPNTECKTLTGYLFRRLNELDNVLGHDIWRQSELPL